MKDEGARLFYGRACIVKMRFGSHLYGTDTKDSDTDYKGIFLPTYREILLGTTPKSLRCMRKKKEEEKNTKEDTDLEMYSLNYFIKLAAEGQTVALDMLHAPANFEDVISYIWVDLKSKREMFYTKNLKAFIGYARRQASKYGVKGSRLDTVKKVIKYFNDLSPEAILGYYWDDLPTLEHIYKSQSTDKGGRVIKMYEVCGKKIQSTASVGYALNIFNRFYEEYGKRAHLAARNKGIDWKAVSHAIRAAMQTKEILTGGKITFPLKEAGYLRRVKAGELLYKDVATKLDDLITEVEDLSKRSHLPEKVDIEYWDNWLINVLAENVFYGKFVQQ